MSYETFAGHPLVREVPEELVVQLYELGELQELGPGVEVLHEGAPPRYLFAVLTGELEVFLPKNEQRLSRVTLATVGAGDCVGEYGFVDERPVSASVRSVGESAVLRLAHDDLRRFIENNPVAGYIISRNLMLALVERLRAENDSLDLFYLSGGGDFEGVGGA